MTKMTGFVVVQYCSWSLAVKSDVLSAYCLFVCFLSGQVGTLQVHVHPGIQISVYFCITVLTFLLFFFFLFGSLSLSFPALFCLVTLSLDRRQRRRRK